MVAGDQELGNDVKENVLILPLRGQVMFPGVRTSVTLSQEIFDEVRLHLDNLGDSSIGAVAMQPTPGGEVGKVDSELYEVGTYCRLVNNADATGSDGKRAIKLMLEGTLRFKILRLFSLPTSSQLRTATVEMLEEDGDADSDVEVRALVHNIQERMSELLRGGQASPESKTGETRTRQRQVIWPAAPVTLSSMVGATLVQLSVEERQQILNLHSMRDRLSYVLDLVQREAEAKRLLTQISASIQRSREQELRQVVLQRQIQEVQKDLQRLHTKVQRESDSASEDPSGAQGEEEEEDEKSRLAEKLNQAGLSEAAAAIAKRELKRLKTIQPHHPEYTNINTYLELLSTLPWKKSSEDRFDLARARAILDEDHRGLEKVKIRILEFLAVQKMRGSMNGPILCLHGPPGIGKTSLGRSISRALGRKFHRLALGGVRDEAELRGHRRTYIGSIPGAIIQAFQGLGVNNPVILLDEVDKMAQNQMFNPQATLLEILDPEQNSTFKDHYLNTPFDLSKVLFICTANDISMIDRPLLDRMEVVELSGYTVEEKMAITTTHLLPKQRRLHALESEPQADATTEEGSDTRAVPTLTQATVPRLEVTKEAIHSLTTRWTSESGVRNLERRLAQLCRWAALRLQGVGIGGPLCSEREAAESEDVLASCGPDQDGRIVIEAHHLPHIVGSELFEPDIAERLVVGVAMGLSVSSVGGQLLFIEATRTKGAGKLTITGQLGKVMSESVETALSLLRSRFVRIGKGHSEMSSVPSKVLSLLQSRRAPGDGDAGSDRSPDGDRDPFKGEDVHVHFPAGGIPKDGPSAGVAVLLSLASLLLDRPMRSDTAVTGEVTLRGHVLPVGGIRDKVLAAHRAGVQHVLLPRGNKRHVLEEVPVKTLKGIQVHYMKHVDEALDWAFGKSGREEEPAVHALAPRVAPPELPTGVPAAADVALSCMAPASGLMAALPPISRL